MRLLRWLTICSLLEMGSGAAHAQIRFEDSAKKSGLNFTLKNSASGQFRQVELMPGGVAALDYDNDGCVDIFFTNGAALPSLRKTGPEFSNRLFRNNCDSTFTDVTSKAGVAGRGLSRDTPTPGFGIYDLARISLA